MENQYIQVLHGALSDDPHHNADLTTKSRISGEKSTHGTEHRANNRVLKRTLDLHGFYGAAPPLSPPLSLQELSDQFSERMTRLHICGMVYIGSLFDRMIADIAMAGVQLDPH